MEVVDRKLRRRYLEARELLEGIDGGCPGGCGRPRGRTTKAGHCPACYKKYVRPFKTKWPIDIARENATPETGIPLGRKDGTIAGYALVDAEDFAQLSAWRWFVETKGYARRTVNTGTSYIPIRMHREIAGLAREDPRQVDHINGDKLDNRRANLRIVTNAENQQNLTSLRSTNTSGYRGVQRNRGRWGKPWLARANVAGRRYALGAYDTAEEADAAVKAFRAQHMPFSSDAQVHVSPQKSPRAVSSAAGTTRNEAPDDDQCS